MASDTSVQNGYSTRSVKDKVADVAQSTAANVATNVQVGLSKTQDALSGSLGKAQEVLGRNQKSSGKNMQQAQKKAQAIQGKVQDNVQSGLGQAQSLLAVGTAAAQQALKEKTKKAQKKLQKAQAPVQDAVQSTLTATQAALAKNAAKAGKNLKQVKDSVSDMQDSMQERAAAHQRRRARAKFLFRLGLIAGLIGALLYSPWTGEETRARLGEYWQQLQQKVQNQLQ